MFVWTRSGHVPHSHTSARLGSTPRGARLNLDAALLFCIKSKQISEQTSNIILTKLALVLPMFVIRLYILVDSFLSIGIEAAKLHSGHEP